MGKKGTCIDSKKGRKLKEKRVCKVYWISPFSLWSHLYTSLYCSVLGGWPVCTTSTEVTCTLASGWCWPRGALEGGRLQEGSGRVKSEYFPTSQISYKCLNPSLEVTTPARQPCPQSSMGRGPSSGPLPSTTILEVVSTPHCYQSWGPATPLCHLTLCLYLCKQSLYELLEPFQFKYVMYFLLGPWMIHMDADKKSK